jgi:hypothetical protein
MRPGAPLVTVLSLTLLVSACTPPPENPPPSATAAIPAIPPTAVAVTPLADRQLVALNIRYADELAFVLGFLWVKTSDGRVVQIDPADNTIVGELKVDATTDLNHNCMGLGTDGRNVWACSASEVANSGDGEEWTIDVVVVDPQSLTLIATVPVDKIFDQFQMPFLNDQIWVLTGDGSSLVGIDTTTFEPGPAIALGTRCASLAASGQALVAACPLTNQVLRIDPETRAVVTRAEVPAPRAIFADDQSVWVAQDNAVMRLDLTALTPLIVFANLPAVGFYGDVFVTNQAVWIRQPSGFLYRVDPASNTIVEQIAPPEAMDGGSVRVAADSIWTSANEDHSLYRLSLR